MFTKPLTPSRLRFSVLLLSLSFVGPALAQSNTCDGNENIPGTSTLPPHFTVNQAAPGLTDTITLTGAGCIDQPGGDDFVACFIPTNSCTVDISCFYTPVGGGTSATNLYSGACSTSPASCIASTSGTGTPQTISGASLTAGTQYCVVCSNNVNLTSIDMSMDATAGSDCGALPIQLQSFAIE